MKDCINKRLTAGAWTAITTSETCSLYSVKADQSDVAFKMKKKSDDTEYWTIEPKDKGQKAQITVSAEDSFTGTIFYLQAASAPLDVEVFLA